ncbi:hypothetical protein [Bacillus manliponensis]|uniref:hypothetical protein n=1 Tax=Bacillus manliponensis TaxID=574376 RepID=UPI003511635E
MLKKYLKPFLNSLLFLGVFLFAHMYLKNASFSRYILVTAPMLIAGLFSIDIALSFFMKKE